MPKNDGKSVKVSIPIQQGENLVHFPNKCVYCEKPPTRAYKITVSAQEEVGEVRKIFAQKAYLRTLAGVKKLTSTTRTAVPYCKEHYMAAWVDKWVFGSIGIIALLVGMSIIGSLCRDTFLAEGYWTIVLLLLGLFGEISTERKTAY